MKKLLTLVLALGIISLSACTGGAAISGAPAQAGDASGALPGANAAKPEPTPAPTPIPTPKRPHVDIYISSGGDEAQANRFVELIADDAFARGMTSRTLQEGDALTDECDAVVVYAAAFDYADFADIIAADVPVAVYSEEEPALASPTSASPTSATADAEAVDERFSLLYYDMSASIDALYESALTYPPHDTPVRLAGMFESEESPLAVRFEELYEEGKVLPKARFFANGEETPMEWLPGFLGDFVEGTVDGIVVETAELALEAFRALTLEGRSDMEIFCLESTKETTAAMFAAPDIFVAAVGGRIEPMAMKCLEIALSDEGGKEYAFAPGVAHDAELKPVEAGFGIAEKPEPTPEPTSEPTPTPEPTPKTLPTPSPTPKTLPTPEPSPTPKTLPTPEPSPTPKTLPTPEPSPTPKTLPTPEASPTPGLMPL